MSVMKNLLYLILLSTTAATAVNLLSPLSFNVLLAPIKTPIKISNPLSGLASIKALAMAKAVIGTLKNKPNHKQSDTKPNQDKNVLKFVIPNHPLSSAMVKPHIHIHATNIIPPVRLTPLQGGAHPGQPVTGPVGATVVPQSVAYSHRSQHIVYNPVRPVSPTMNHHFNRGQQVVQPGQLQAQHPYQTQPVQRQAQHFTRLNPAGLPMIPAYTGTTAGYGPNNFVHHNLPIGHNRQQPQATVGFNPQQPLNTYNQLQKLVPFNPIANVAANGQQPGTATFNYQQQPQSLNIYPHQQSPAGFNRPMVYNNQQVHTANNNYQQISPPNSNYQQISPPNSNYQQISPPNSNYQQISPPNSNYQQIYPANSNYQQISSPNSNNQQISPPISNFQQMSQQNSNYQQLSPPNSNYQQIPPTNSNYQQLRSVNYFPQHLPSAGYNHQQLPNAGYSQQLPMANYFPQQSNNVGYNPQQSPNLGYNLHRPPKVGYNPQQPLSAGYNHQQLPPLGYNRQQSPTTGYPANYNHQQFPTAIYNHQELPAKGSKYLQPSIGYKIPQSPSGYNPQQLQTNFSPVQLQIPVVYTGSNPNYNIHQPPFNVQLSHQQISIPGNVAQVTLPQLQKPSSTKDSYNPASGSQHLTPTSYPTPQVTTNDASLLNQAQIQSLNINTTQPSKYSYYYIVKIAHPKPNNTDPIGASNSDDVISIQQLITTHLMNESVTITPLEVPVVTSNITTEVIGDVEEDDSGGENVNDDVETENDQVTSTKSVQVSRRRDNDTDLSFRGEPRVYAINLESKPVYVYNYYKLYQLDHSGLKPCTIGTCYILQPSNGNASHVYKPDYDHRSWDGTLANINYGPRLLDSSYTKTNYKHDSFASSNEPRDSKDSLARHYQKDGSQDDGYSEPVFNGAWNLRFVSETSKAVDNSALPSDLNEDNQIEETISKYIKRVLQENNSNQCDTRLLCEVNYLLKLLRRRTTNLNVVLRLRRSSEFYNTNSKSDIIVESISKSGCYRNYNNCPSLDIEYLLRKLITVQFHR